MKSKLLILAVIFFGSILFSADSRLAEAALPSQCTGGQGTGQVQVNCDKSTDAAVLDQCKKIYLVNDCSSVSSYLNKMSADCEYMRPAGIDCNKIPEGGFYGREAAKFAALGTTTTTTAATPVAPATATTTNGCGVTTTPVNGVIEFSNPLCYNSVEEVLMALLVNLQSLLVIIAIVLVVIGGIMYMFSGANEKLLEKAKSTIGGALIGLAIVLAAPSFLKQIKDILGSNWTGTNSEQIVSQALTLKQILVNILNFLLSIVGILGIIGLVIGGTMYLLAYGDEDRVKLGKEIITSSLVGIVIAFGALIVVKQVAILLGAPV